MFMVARLQPFFMNSSENATLGGIIFILSVLPLILLLSTPKTCSIFIITPLNFRRFLMTRKRILVTVTFLCLLTLAPFAYADGEPILKSISSSESAKLIKENKDNSNFIILDVRTPDEFKNGHLKNAVQLNFYDSNFVNELEELDRTKTYLIHCHSGGRSGKTLQYMRMKGFQNVYNMSGGIKAWRTNHYSTVN